MNRSFFSLALAVAMMAGAGTAMAKEFAFEFSGHGHHGHGHGHADEVGGYADAHAFAFGGYPNGRDNYGELLTYCPPFGPCKTCSAGNCQYRFYGQPDLFYNYYAWPSCSGVGAQLYISPYPVPPHVGHTFITYQPLMPHEFLYEHERTYHRYYNGGQGLNRTCVKWYHSPWPW